MSLPDSLHREKRDSMIHLASDFVDDRMIHFLNL